MPFSKKIAKVQEQLAAHKVDGWLLYDFQKNNPLALEFLEIPRERNLTRRFFYWIPSKGIPLQIVHKLEPHALELLPGKKRVFLRWQELEQILKDLLTPFKVIAMEYSERCAVPYISKVDAGTMDLVRSFGVKVISSAPFIQEYSSMLDSKQVQSLKEAEQVIKIALDAAWGAIHESLQKGKSITDCDVQKLILSVFEKHDCTTNAPPHCAINADSADPHFSPNPDRPVPIRKGDFILIDLWCKKKMPRAIYADITQVGIAAKKPTPKQQEIFSIVHKAQQAAIAFIRQKIKQGIKGYEVDQVCRNIVEKAGYGDYFIHRTGHNISTDVHGPGTHFDSLETYDDRPVLKETCSSCEPGIYLPGEFGVRLECDLFIDSEGNVQVIGGEQEKYILV